jgi:hypothetical protein
MFSFSFQCDSEGEDDKVSMKPECYLELVMALWQSIADTDIKGSYCVFIAAIYGPVSARACESAVRITKLVHSSLDDVGEYNFIICIILYRILWACYACTSCACTGSSVEAHHHSFQTQRCTDLAAG